MVARLVILVATYLLIAVRQVPFLRLNRPAAALLGAVAMVRSAVCRCTTPTRPSIST
jgi:hypothetical protein